MSTTASSTTFDDLYEYGSDSNEQLASMLLYSATAISKAPSARLPLIREDLLQLVELAVPAAERMEE